MNDMLEGLCLRCKEHILLPKELLISTIPPSLSGLSRMNVAPPESEVEDLKTSRERIRHSIAELDDQIRDLTLALEKIRIERSRLQVIDDEYTTLLSPIRRIPREILSEIFLHTQNRYGPHQVFEVLSPSWVLSWVCSLWRTVVVNCSEFWCNLDVYPRRKVTENAAFLLRTTISRARERKLILRLRLSYGFSSDWEVPFLLNILMESSDRWLTANLNLPPQFLPALAPLHGRLDSLERLNMYCQDSALNVHIGAFEVAPRLQSVWICGLEGTVVSLLPSRLMSFRDDRPYGDDTVNAYFLDIIRNAPDLHTFRVGHQSLAIDGAFSVASRILHPNIHVLHACEGSFLRSLTLPELEHMHVGVGRVNAPCPSNSLLGLYDLLKHSHCSLRSLRIINPWSLEIILLDILQLTPRLEDFYFSTIDWRNDFNTVMQTMVSRMFDKDDSDRLCLIPELNNFDFIVEVTNISAPLAFCDKALVGMVSARWNPVVGKRKLRHVHIQVYHGLLAPGSLSQDDQSRLDVYREEGLDISIRDTDIRYV